MMPLPQLIDGLGRHRIDVVHRAFDMHFEAFQKILFFSREDKNFGGSMVEKHMSKMAILFETVVNHARRSRGHQFYRRVIMHALDHIDLLMCELQSAVASRSLLGYKKAIEEMLTYHGNQLQSMLDSSVPSSRQGSPRGSPIQAAKPHPLWARWKNRSDEEVIREAVLEPEAFMAAKKLMIETRGWKPEDWESRLQPLVDTYVFELLKNKKLDVVKDVYSNTGWDIRTRLKDLCVKTSNADVRNYIALELNELQLLSNSEIDAWKFLLSIEEIMKTKGLRLAENGKVLNVGDSDDDENNLSIEGVLSVESQGEWRTETVMEIFFRTLDRTLEDSLDKETSWNYLLLNDKIDILRTWIDAVYGKDKGHVVVGQIDSSPSRRLKTLFSSWPLSQTMIDHIMVAKCEVSTKDCVLDHLSKFNVFTTEESSDVRKRLLRMARTGCLMKAKDSLRKPLLEFIVAHDIPEMLAACELDAAECQTPWVQLYEKFRIMMLHPEEAECVYDCAAATTEFLNIDITSDPILAISTVLLSPYTMKDVIESQESTALPINKDELAKVLRSFPKLEAAVNNTLSGNSVDITLDELLAEYCDCNLNHLIKRSDKSSEKCETQDPWKERPHFSSESLIARFGHRETLSYRYYLKQGRPSFAASLVLTDQCISVGKLSRKLLKKACYSAHGLSLSHYSNQLVTASCVAFIEMLGGNTVTLRAHIAAANFILAYEKLRTGDEQSSQKDVLHMLENLALGDRQQAAQEMLTLLELAISCEEGFAAVKAQGLAVRLARIHHLPLPTDLLKRCAKRDDWMTFLLISQIYGYPLHVVKKLMCYFKCPHIRQHLEHSLNRMAASGDVTPVKVSVGTSRHHYYSRIFKQETQALTGFGQSKSSINSSCELPSSSSDVSDEGLSSDLFEERNDLFRVLLLCSKSANPGSALLNLCIQLPSPVLAVLACCLQPEWSVQCLCAWLLSWLPKDKRKHFKQTNVSRQWCAENFETLILQSLKAGHIALIVTAFQLFLPTCVLLHVLEAIDDCATTKVFDKCAPILIRFKQACEDLDSFPPEESGDASYLQNGPYLLNLGIKIVLKAFEYLFDSACDQRRFLNIMCKVNLFENVEDVKSKAQCVLNVMDILSETDLSFYSTHWFKDFQNEIQSCIDALVREKYFRQAAQICAAVNQNVDSVIIAECVQTTYHDVKIFCRNCNARFEEGAVNPETAYEFFYGCVGQLHSHVDRWLMLHAARLWLCKCATDKTAKLLEALETEMWKCCLLGDCNTFFQTLKDELKATPLSQLHCEQLGISVPFGKGSVSNGLADEEKVSLSRLVDILLDVGDIASACRLRFLFGADHQDLRILETCLCLIEEKISVSDLNDVLPASSSLLETSGSFLRSSMRSYLQDPDGELMSSVRSQRSDFVEIPSPEKQERLTALQRLCDHLTHGEAIGLQLTACYRLAVNLDLSYQEVTSVIEPLKLLRTALSEAWWNHYSIASDVVTALKLTPEEAAEFICREVVAAVSKSCAQSGGRDCVMWGYDLETNFHRVINLAPDPSILGNKLLKMVTKLTIVDKNIPKEVLITAVELLIRSHDCYTAVCNMEGIANVLHQVSTLTKALNLHSEWALLVRLLTGIQRYTEMSFIFKLLKENDQFEYLLRKDSIKTASLKTAILEWLRRECPNDTMLLKMTAAHFKMRREEAALWEAEGNQRIRTVVAQGLNSDANTKSVLHTALQDFTHAAECYLQANMVNHAMMSAHQAELIALQIHLVTTATDKPPLCLLLLDAKSVSQLITNNLSFPEAQLVIRAYNHHTDWGAALFHHCVVAPDADVEEYFSAWNASMELTPSLIQDVAHRFQRAAVVTKHMIANMCRLLSHVQDMEVRYRIASELGFKNFVEDLLQAPEVVYLKDTVWQIGFKG